MADFFLTQNEMFAAFVELTEYVARVNVAAAGPINSVDGLQIVEGDTSGGGFTLTLEDPSLADPRWTCFIVNTGGNALTIDPGAALINGQAGTVVINDQWKTLILRHDGTDFWVGNRLTPTFPAPDTLSSFQLEYNVEDAFAAGAIWTDSGRTTLAVADDEIDNLDASAVVVGAASTPRADIQAGSTGKPRLRAFGGTYLDLPPNGNPCLSMFAGNGSDGGLDTDWEGIAPFEDLVASENFTISFVARLYDVTNTGKIFHWFGGELGSGQGNVGFQTELLNTSGYLLTFARDENANSDVVNTNPNAVDGGWKTYTLTWDGTTLTVYEDAVVLASAELTLPDNMTRLTPKSAIGHGFTYIGGVPDDSFDWDFAAMAFFNEVLSSLDRGIVTDYYNNRYGI
jgi:hypothetical protein